MEDSTQHFCQKTTFPLHPSNKISTSHACHFDKARDWKIRSTFNAQWPDATWRWRRGVGTLAAEGRGRGGVSCQIWKRRANQRRKGVSQVIERWWDCRRDRHTANGRRWSRKVSDAKSCRSSPARPRIYSANIVACRDGKWENMGIKSAWKVGPLRLFWHSN